MTEHSEFSEICITLNYKEYNEIFTSEVADFTNEGLEFAESGGIIIRTSQNMEFIDTLLAHLQGFCKNLSAINNQNITFSHTITTKQNRDWIAEYKRGIKPLQCGRFYIYPPWEKPLGNSSLGLHSADFANLGHCTDFSLALRPKFAKNHESQTENPSVVDSARNAQNLGENLPIHCHSERSEESQKKNNRDSSPTAQNDNLRKFAESSLDSAPSTQWANSSIFDEKSGLCSCERENRTNGSLTKRATNLPDLSQKDAEFATINIILEPSLAFGTGHHASTFMCIEAIQALDSHDLLKNKKLLDFGCGSGILALCASKLGAVVDLCDIDESAIVESKKNFNNNNATISHIWQGSIDKCAMGANPAKSGIYDIIVANIIASVLIEQKDNIDSSLKCGGIAVLSGILDIYKDEVLAHFAGFMPLAICQKDEWICATLQKL